MGSFFSLKNSKFFSGLKKNDPIVASITTQLVKDDEVCFRGLQCRISILANCINLYKKKYRKLELPLIDRTIIMGRGWGENDIEIKCKLC